MLHCTDGDYCKSCLDPKTSDMVKKMKLRIYIYIYNDKACLSVCLSAVCLSVCPHICLCVSFSKSYILFHGFGLVLCCFRVFSWFLSYFHVFSRHFYGYQGSIVVFKIVSWLLDALASP